MKPPTGPFWLWTDIGVGERWFLCAVEHNHETPLLRFLTEDFSDNWYDDDWDEEYFVLIAKPENL